jgi:hypothetical protein
MADKHDEAGIPAWLFWLGSLIFVLAIGAIIWFAIPGIDAKHRFTSPSGRVVLEVGENCGETACRRVIVSEETAADGTKSRFGCNVPITDQRPVFLNMHPLWSGDESSVDLVYADAEGIGGKFTLVLERDCTITG